MQRRKTQIRAGRRPGTMLMLVLTVLALGFATFTDIHAAEARPDEAGAQVIDLHDPDPADEAAGTGDSNHYCQTPSGCHAGLQSVAWPAPIATTGAGRVLTPLAMIGAPPTHGLFRPPRQG